MSKYYIGNQQSWEEYLRHATYEDIKGEIRNSSIAERMAILRQTREIVTSRRAMVSKISKGFGSMNNTLKEGFTSIESAIRDTNGTLEELKSSFDYNMALLIDQLQLQNQTTMAMLDKLETIHSTLENPLVTQARELFRIGSERMLKGLLDKALDAFLESAAKDETNFLTQLLIGKLFLYGVNEECNVVDLGRAERHLLSAARYARAESRQLPEASKYEAEALLHAAISYYAMTNREITNGNKDAAQRAIKRAYELASEATRVSPQLSEGHYHKAKFAALIGDGKASAESLETAISIDEGYSVKAQEDKDFRYVRKDISSLFDRLKSKSERKAMRRLRMCEAFLTDWHYPTIEAKTAKQEIKQLIDEAKKCLANESYFDNQDAIRLLQEAEQIFQSLTVHNFALHSLSIHTGRVTSLTFSPNQAYLASGGADSHIHIWLTHDNQHKYTLRGHNHGIADLQFSHDGQALASVDKKGVIKIWNVEDGTLLFDLVDNTPSPVQYMAFSPDDTLLAAGYYDHRVILWRMDDGTPYRVLTGHKSSVDTLVFNQDGALLATGSPDNSAILWDVENGTELHTFFGCSGLANSLLFSPRGDRLIIGANEGSVSFYSLTDGEKVHELEARPGAVSWLSLSPDCTMLATLNFGKALQLWDLQTGKLVHNLKPFSPGVSSVRFSPDGTTLAGNDYQDRSVKLWSTSNGRLLHVIAGSVSCNTFSPDGSFFVTGDETGSLKFWGRAIKKQKDGFEPEIRSSVMDDDWTPPASQATGADDGGAGGAGVPLPESAVGGYEPAPRPERPIQTESHEPVRESGPRRSTATEFHDLVEPAEPAEIESQEELLRRELELLEQQPVHQIDADDLSDFVEVLPDPGNGTIDDEPENGIDADAIGRTPEEQAIIDERIRNQKCYICGDDIGVIARLAGIRVCNKHYFDD